MDDIVNGTKIKFCGMRFPGDVETANELKADHIGFVFARKSRRYVKDEEAHRLSLLARSDIVKVGVFVDEDIDHIISLFDGGVIDVAQLHGHEDEDYIKRLRHIGEMEVWKAFSVRTHDDIKLANASGADLVLLDNGAGGTGEGFDHALLNGVKRPFILAGGLSPENVGDIVRVLRPYAVDVSSGIETDGVKDAAKMRAFAEAVRRAKNI